MKNWKTTLIGLLAAAGNITANGTTLKQFIISAVIAALGTWAHDPKKEG